MIRDKITVGHHTLKNRMVKAPIYTGSCTPDGKVTDKTLKHYEERTADGRFGLVIAEHSYVRQDGIAGPGQLSATCDSDIDGLARIAEIIHRNGSKAILQINHAGCDAKKELTGFDSVGASDFSVPCGLPGSKPNPVPPKPLTENEILALEDCYIRAAARGMKAGFDGIEIHSAHAYLLNQFYSPLANKRTDSYNGYTLSGRTKMHCEIIRGIRQTIGDTPLLALRLGGCDYLEGGTTIEDSVQASLLFEKLGIDLIDISGGLSSFTRAGHPEPGYFGEITEAIRKAVHIPVLLTGGVKKVSDAEGLLQEGKADLIGVGRAITADTAWGKELLG